MALAGDRKWRDNVETVIRIVYLVDGERELLGVHIIQLIERLNMVKNLDFSLLINMNEAHDET